MGRDTDLRLIESEQHAQHYRLAAPAHAHACTARARRTVQRQPLQKRDSVRLRDESQYWKHACCPSNTQLKLAGTLQDILHEQ